MRDRVDIITNIITDDLIAVNNRDLLRRLTRIVTRSQGFSLSIILCNYRVLQERILQELRSQLVENQLPETAIAILALEPETKTLLASIQVLMESLQGLPPEQKPKALMVLGLDAVIEIEAVLKSANRVREAFANCLEFPMILWLSDRTQDILTREASDLANWATAGSIEFRLEPMELIELLHKSTESIFSRFVDVGDQGFRHAPLTGGLQQFELVTAIAELDAQGFEIDINLRASLDFGFGCIDLAAANIDKAKDWFRKSLAVWEVDFAFENQVQNQLAKAVCLMQLGICDRAKAFDDRFNKKQFHETSCEYFVNGIAIFRELGRWDLVAEYINFLTATLEELSIWDGLEALITEALALRQTYPNLLREAHDYAILASVKIAEADYSSARELAESALSLYHEAEVLKLPNLLFSERYVYAKYELWLARALSGLGEKASAIARLESVSDRWNHQYECQIYVSVLEELRSLYTSTGLYLKAFQTKQHQRSVEQQYGLRAFIGAGTLKPKREGNNPDMYVYSAIIDQDDGIAQEIEASGRMPDVIALVQRIYQPRFPLTVIHGDSGAGKSSILTGVFIPALRNQRIFDHNFDNNINIIDKKVLVLEVRTYKDWDAKIQNQLKEHFGNSRPDLNLIQHFKQNADEEYLTVLIFDQFEDFFFKKEKFKQREPFYRFLKACLHCDFVRVVLSLREDYLHYLLECDRAVNLEKIGNDILGKEMRYYVGNLTQAQARQTIESLTKRAQLRLDENLIDLLVTDLSDDQNTISPIELQVVGAQLEFENPPIITRSQYLALTSHAKNAKRKPSEVLVERWLENVVNDCGEDNQLAERVLYALTGNEEKRPNKTEAELAAELPLSPTSNLSLVLAVLIGSGLAFRISSIQGDRYQLIHDYLVSFIREKYVFGIAEGLRISKKQLQLALAKTEQELKRAELAEIKARSHI